MLQRILTLLLIGCCWLSTYQRAAAQSNDKILPDQVKYNDGKKQGWFPDLNAGFNFAFAQSDGVVGVQDGTTISFGFQVDGSLTFVRRTHEWRTTLLLIHTQTKLPTLEPFVKSADKFELETAYTYRLPSVPWFGFFALLRLETPLLPGFLVTSQNVQLQIKEPTATTYTPFADKPTLNAQEGFQLTNAFAPLLFKQLLGVDFLPYNEEYFRINIKAGAGAIEAFTQGGLRIDENNAATNQQILLGRMQDYFQVGAEARLNINGKLFQKLLTYTLTSGVMVPFYSTVTNGKSIPELINFDLSLKIGIQVFKWLAVNYALSIVRAPLIVPDKLQITNNLMLSLTWNIL